MVRWLVTAILILTVAYAIFQYAYSPTNQEVVIYVSHDQDYSEPILKAFEAETGITVRAIYDTEASKTVGLTNRLIAEKDNPQADVFWNNEVTRTVQLQKEGVLQQYYPDRYEDIDPTNKDVDGFWTGFAARARVLVVNPKELQSTAVPESVQDLVSDTYQGKVTLADPRFGTTGSHLAALYTMWGEEVFVDYLKNLQDNGIDIAQSNGSTRDKVVAGEKWIGFTDTDDAHDAITKGESIETVYPDQSGIGTLIIPNTVMLIKGAPNIDAAQQLINYLVSEETEAQLAASNSAQIPLLPNVNTPDTMVTIDDIKAMPVNWHEVSQNLDVTLNLVEEYLLID